MITQDKLHAMINVLAFINNYPYDWPQQVFHDDKHLADHITEKWNSYAKRTVGETAQYNAIVSIMSELSHENQRKLMEWIDKEKFGKGGVINSGDELALGETYKYLHSKNNTIKYLRMGMSGDYIFIDKNGKWIAITEEELPISVGIIKHTVHKPVKRGFWQKKVSPKDLLKF